MDVLNAPDFVDQTSWRHWLTSVPKEYAIWELSRLYEQENKAKLCDVEKIVDKYSYSWYDMYNTACEKYGVEPYTLLKVTPETRTAVKEEIVQDWNPGTKRPPSSTDTGSSSDNRAQAARATAESAKKRRDHVEQAKYLGMDVATDPATVTFTDSELDAFMDEKGTARTTLAWHWSQELGNYRVTARPWPKSTYAKHPYELSNYYKTSFVRSHKHKTWQKVEDKVFMRDYIDLDWDADFLLTFTVLENVRVDGKTYLATSTSGDQGAPHTMRSGLAREFQAKMRATKIDSCGHIFVYLIAEHDRDSYHEDAEPYSTKCSPVR